MKGKRNILVILGLIFFIIAPSFSFVLAPSMKKIPDNLHETVYYEGRFGMFNSTTLKMDYKNIEIKREINAMKKEGDILLIREDISVKDKRTGEGIPDLKMTKIYGIDPYTSKNVPGYGDTERIGQWIFPLGVKKEKEYLVWNTDMDDVYKQGYVDTDDATGIAYYIGEKKIAGVKTYGYAGHQDEVYIGPGPEGTPPEAKLYYSGDQTAWADTKTGTIIDYDKHVIQHLEFPDLHKLPSDLNTTAELAGSISIFNISKVGESDWYDRYNAVITNHIWVEDTSMDSMYLVGNEVIAEDETGRMLPDELQGEGIDGVNPYTMEYDHMFSDKQGLLTFPIGVEKRDYVLWDSDTKKTSTAYFEGEENIAGLNTYKYVTRTNNCPIGIQDIDGMSDRHANLIYTGNTTYWVEPSTGSIVNARKEGTANVQFPDLHTIPENTNAKVDMEGELWIISQGSKDIDMVRNVKVTDTCYDEEGKKVIIFEDNTTVYDSSTGEKVPEGCSLSIHGVYADTGREAQNYGDMAREGLYTFPPGPEKRDYSMWNSEIGVPSPVDFVREEGHVGMHTYLYETRETRKVFDPTPSINQNVIYTTTTKYWVEPNSGSIIDMEKQSEKKVDILNYLFGISSPIWVKAYTLTLSFTDDMVKELIKEGKQSSELIQLSGKTVPATQVDISSTNLLDNVKAAEQQKKQVEQLSGNRVKAGDLHYWMTESSVGEMADKAKTSGFLLTLMEAIIPILLIVFGVALIALWAVNKPK